MEKKIIILNAVREIPFGVGKNLLADVLAGNKKNKSIIKNNLDKLSGFGAIRENKEKILEEIDHLILGGFLEKVRGESNRFMSLLRISQKGIKAIKNPKEQLKKNNYFDISQVTEEDREKFKELGVFLNGLNDEQKKAAISGEKNILCIAGAGSGKTLTLVKRIEFLTKYAGVDPGDILAVTFTRKASLEMVSRLKKAKVEGVNVHTFNSFCEKVLRKHESLIYDVPTRVQKYSDKAFAINAALENLGLSFNDMKKIYFSNAQIGSKEESELFNLFMNDCFSLLDFFKINNCFDEAFRDADPKYVAVSNYLRKIVLFLNDFMKLNGLRDYTDQIIDTCNFFKKNGHLIPKFKHLLVDEFQDVNKIQIDLINLLSPENRFFVGDPRQSIFGWRGSSISYILNFQKDNPGAQVINLHYNYRSPKRIVDFMNESIKDFGFPDLKSCAGEGGEICLLDFEQEEEEINFVLRKILELEIPLEEIFVLARTNRQLDEISYKMHLKKIPHIIKTDETGNFVEKKEGHVLLATIHAVKGLESRVVFLVGANNQNFPCKASDHPALEAIKMDAYDRHDEERRLFYVAISRPKEKLFITYSKKPTYFLNSSMLEIINGNANNKPAL